MDITPGKTQVADKAEQQPTTEDIKRKTPVEDDNDNRLKYKVLVRNRYEPLSDISDESDDEEQATVEPPAGRAHKPKRPTPPPPIMLHDVHNHRELTKLIATAVTGKYTLKYTRDGVILHVTEEKQRASIITKLIKEKVNFHTYTKKEARGISYVIRGLSKETSINDVLCEMEKKYKIIPTRCVQMKTKGQPLMIVTLPATIPRAQLQKIDEIDKTIIRLERYVTEKRITQCHNCQMWGHATSNYHAQPKCLKCAKEYYTHECQKPREQPAKCVNCSGEHPANAISCPAFARRKAWLDERGRQRQPERQRDTNIRATPNITNQEQFPALRRTFAPAPAANPWHTGAARGGQAGPTTMQTAAPRPTTQQASTAQPATASFYELAKEMKTLNELININEVLTQIRNLNALLRQANSRGERMQIAVQFFASLP